MSDEITTAEFEEYLKRRTADGHALVTKQLAAWRTPASSYPRSKLGKARVSTMFYEDGTYMCYGVEGADLLEITKRIKVTVLKIDGKVWMVDDPWHYWQIAETAAKLEGHVLVGGLGLGLIVHELAANDRVTDITVIERDPDVIALVGPLVPKCRIIEDDVWNIVRSPFKFNYTVAFCDLWVTHGTADTRRCYHNEVLPLAAEFKLHHGIDMYALGFTGSEAVLGDDDDETTTGA